MSTVDSKVVELKFDNKGFAEGVKSTLKGLADLNNSLAKGVATSSLDSLGKAADNVSHRFSLMGIAGAAVVANLATKAVNAGESFVKSFTLDPITAGFHNYETQIGAVQTILANTGLEGSKGLKTVTATLADLNQYANLTVYNFSEMAKNIGTFTAAGVGLKPAASAIKGIANLAALSGANSDQASNAMYQLSQALAANRVKQQDWNSVVNAGLGGKIFQNALYNTALAIGTIKKTNLNKTLDDYTKSGHTFRDVLSSGAITGKVLSQTLGNFTNNLSSAQLKSEGYTDDQIKQIKKIGNTAYAAATQIKTYSQLTQALKEEVATGYAAIFTTLFGNITTATALFSPLHNAIENGLTNPLKRFNLTLQGWSKLGGRTRILDGIHYALKDIQAILIPIQKAFRVFFPAETAKNLYALTNSVEKFFQYAKIGANTAVNLRHTFEGFFAVLDIGKTVIEAAAKFIGKLFEQLTKGEGSKGFLSITGHIGLFLVALDKSIKKGQGLTDFFDGLLKALAGPIKLFHEATQAIAELFGGKATKGGNDLEKKLSPLETIPQRISDEWSKLQGVYQKAADWVQAFAAKTKPFATEVEDNVKKAATAVKNFFTSINFAKVGADLLTVAKFIGHAFVNISDAAKSVFEFIKPLGPKIAETFKDAANGIGNFFNGLDYTHVLSTINTGLFAGLVLLVKKFLGTAGKTVGSAGGFLDTIKEPFEALTGTLKSMQQTLKAAVLLEIAVAIGILAASCIALASINSSKLTSALQAVGAMMAELLGSLVVFSKVGGVSGLVAVSAGLVLFAGAIRILTSSVVALAKIDAKSLQNGLEAVGALVGGVVVAAALLGKAEAPMISGGAAMLILSGAIKVLARVVVDLGKVDTNTLKKGLISVGALLGGLALFSQLQNADAGGILAGAGLLLLAEGIKKLAASVKEFGGIDTKTLRKGLISVGIILAGFAIFSQSVGNPASILAASAAMIIIAEAMKLLGKSIETFGNFSWDVIGKGLFVMAAALTAIGVALSLIPPTSLLSAAAILVVAASLKMIGDALVVFGGLSWDAIAKGLVELAGALAIIAAASLVMEAALPGAAAILVVAAALRILTPVLVTLGGLSWESIGKGLLALAGAFAVIGVAGLLLTPIIPSLLGLGLAVTALGLGITLIGAGVFLFAAGLTAIAAAGAGAGLAIGVLVTTIVKLVPVIATALVQAIEVLVTGLAKALPEIIKAVQKILLDLIKLIVKVAPPLIDAVITIISKLLNVLSDHAPKFFSQMVGLLLSLLKAIEAKTPAIVSAVLGIINAILKGLAGEVGKLAEAGLNIIGGLLVGIGKGIGPVIKSGVGIIAKFIEGIGSAAADLAQSAFTTVINFINSVADAVRTNTQPLIDAGKNLASAIGQGMVQGLKDAAGSVADGAKNLAKGALSSAGSFLGISSPSKEFIKLGNYVAQGFAIGITQGSPGVKAAFQQASGLLNQAVQDSATSINDYKQKLAGSNDTLTKTADRVTYYTTKLAEASKNHKTTASSLEQLRTELKNAQIAHDKAAAAVSGYTKLLALATKEHKLSKVALTDLNVQLKSEHTQLTALSKKYDDYNKQLDDQKQKLQDLIQVRDDYNKSVVTEFNVLPDITTDTTVSSFTTGLTEQIADLAKFTDVLGQLRKAGIDDATYKLLVSKGPAALPFMEELLAQGQTGIANINNLDSQLNAEATAIGAQASGTLYQAGIDVVQGLIDGLEAKKQDISDQMDKIAQLIIASLKISLGIHSPSKAMALLGAFAGDGVVVGLNNSAGKVADAAANLGNTAADSLKKSLSGLNDSVIGIENLNPTITPVLDLSAVKKTAAGLSDMLATGPVLVNDAYLKAHAASSSYQANQNAANQNIAPGDIPTQVAAPVVFNQYNNSPKALSSAEIYRQTKNQLSVAKGALTKNVA